MNVLNYTPSEGISLSKVLQTKNINQHYWTAKVLKAFNDSIECNKKKEYVIKSANKFLTKSFLPSGYCPHTAEFTLSNFLMYVYILANWIDSIGHGSI